MKRDRTNDPPKTAGELLDELERDPEYLARKEGMQRERENNRRTYAEHGRPMHAELAAAGYEVDSVMQLVDLGVEYKGAIPILLKWLPQVAFPPLKEGIVRMLSVPWAKPSAVGPLLREFKRDDPSTTPSVRWAVGNALEVLADDSIFEDLSQFATDRRYGDARQMIIRALGKMKNPEAVPVLITLLRAKHEDEVALTAIQVLGKLRAKEARPYIEPFLGDSRSWVRKDARKALEKISKADSRR
jgi:hypothetical protein